MRLSLAFRLPFPEYFKNLGSINGHFYKHKYWELEHYYYSRDVVNFEINYSTKQDHAGFDFAVGFLGYSIHFIIYDSRHWDDEGECWMSPGKELV